MMPDVLLRTRFVPAAVQGLLTLAGAAAIAVSLMAQQPPTSAGSAAQKPQGPPPSAGGSRGAGPGTMSAPGAGMQAQTRPPGMSGAAGDGERQMLKVRSLYDAAVAAGDIGAILDLCADDVLLMPPGEPSVRGKEAMRAWLVKGRLPRPGNASLSVRVMGDAAVYRADPGASGPMAAMGLAPKPRGPEEQMRAEYLLAKQPDGSWKYQSVIWNSVPPPAAK